jgi:hypothetical protein
MAICSGGFVQNHIGGPKVAIILGAACFLQGCVATRTMSDVFKDKNQGKGTVQVYAVNTDQAWRIGVQILRWDGAGTIEEHHDQNVMLTTMPRYYNERWEPPAAGLSYLGVWVEPVDADHTKVACIIAGRDGAPWTEMDFQRRFQQAVAIVKTGKTLPMDAPVRPSRPTTVTSCNTTADCEEGVCFEHGCRR